MPPKVSIIVPIYNAGKYLEKCLDTLVHQTLEDIEIILVVDCPTDGSDQVARDYAQKDSRIRLIFNEHNLNIGLSRNEGLKIARGEYIGFSDHDDWRELDMYEELYWQAQNTSADVVVGNFDNRFPDRIVPNPLYPCHTDEEKFKEKVFEHLIGDRTKDPHWKAFTLNGAMWHMLYKRELIEKNNIRFQDNKKITFEDLFFLVEIFYAAQKIAYLPNIYYHHLYHGNNGVNSYAYHSTPLVIGYLEKLKTFLEAKHIFHKHSADFFHTVLFYLKESLQNEIKHKSYKSARCQIRAIRKSKPIVATLKAEKLTWPTVKRLKIQKSLLWFILTV